MRAMGGLKRATTKQQNAENMSLSTAVSWVLLVAVMSTPSVALIHNLHIEDDSRAQFFIENFGFEAGGHLILNVTGFKVQTTNKRKQTRKPTRLAKQRRGDLLLFATLHVLSGRRAAVCTDGRQDDGGFHHQAHRHRFDAVPRRERAQCQLPL